MPYYIDGWWISANGAGYERKLADGKITALDVARMCLQDAFDLAASPEIKLNEKESLPITGLDFHQLLPIALVKSGYYRPSGSNDSINEKLLKDALFTLLPQHFPDLFKDELQIVNYLLTAKDRVKNLVDLLIEAENPAQQLGVITRDNVKPLAISLGNYIDDLAADEMSVSSQEYDEPRPRVDSAASGGFGVSPDFLASSLNRGSRDHHAAAAASSASSSLTVDPNYLREIGLGHLIGKKGLTHDMLSQIIENNFFVEEQVNTQPERTGYLTGAYAASSSSSRQQAAPQQYSSSSSSAYNMQAAPSYYAEEEEEEEYVPRRVRNNSPVAASSSSASAKRSLFVPDHILAQYGHDYLIGTEMTWPAAKEMGLDLPYPKSFQKQEYAEPAYNLEETREERKAPFTEQKRSNDGRAG